MSFSYLIVCLRETKKKNICVFYVLFHPSFKHPLLSVKFVSFTVCCSRTGINLNFKIIPFVKKSETGLGAVKPRQVFLSGSVVELQCVTDRLLIIVSLQTSACNGVLSFRERPPFWKPIMRYIPKKKKTSKCAAN